MARGFYLAPLVCEPADLGGGIMCAPKINRQTTNFTAVCQDAAIPNAQCLVLAAGDLSGANADASLVSLVADNLMTPVSSLSNAARNRIQNGLTNKGIPLTLSDYGMVRDFIIALGKWFDPNFTLEQFFIVGT